MNLDFARRSESQSGLEFNSRDLTITSTPLLDFLSSVLPPLTYLMNSFSGRYFRAQERRIVGDSTLMSEDADGLITRMRLPS